VLAFPLHQLGEAASNVGTGPEASQCSTANFQDDAKPGAYLPSRVVWLTRLSWIVSPFRSRTHPFFRAVIVR
jgi:hypothetical protein